VLGDCGENVHGQAVGLREIDGGELHASFHQRADKGYVTRQSVELFDDEFCAMHAARCRRLGQLGTIILP
jgi:hypothetical protein